MYSTYYYLYVLACNNKLFLFWKWGEEKCIRASTLYSVLISVKDAKQSFFFRPGYPGRLGVQFAASPHPHIKVYIPNDYFKTDHTHYLKNYYRF